MRQGTTFTITGLKEIFGIKKKAERTVVAVKVGGVVGVAGFMAVVNGGNVMLQGMQIGIQRICLCQTPFKKHRVTCLLPGYFPKTP